MNKLKNNIDEIINWCEKNNLTIFYGYINEEDSQLLKIYWKKKSENAYEEFLETAKKANASILVLDETIHTLSKENEDVINARETLEGDDLTNFKDALNKIKPYIDHTATFSISFIKDNALFEYTDNADWFDSFMDVYENIAEAESKDDSMEEGDHLTRAEIKKIAKELAENEEFQKCKNERERTYILSKIFDEKYDEHWDSHEIISTAASIFKIDIEPKLRKQQKNKIKEWTAEGLSPNEIADRLEITREQLRKI